jgi:hypothetical protein
MHALYASFMPVCVVCVCVYRRKKGYSAAELMLNVDIMDDEVIRRRMGIKVQPGEDEEGAEEEEEDVDVDHAGDGTAKVKKPRIKMTAERAQLKSALEPIVQP